MAVIDDMRSGFARSSTLMRIVWTNIGVFVLLRIAAIVCVFSGTPDFINSILSQIELPSTIGALLTRPWTLITYMFAQYDLLHIVFNMLWLYWFGTMFRMVCTSRQLFVLYIYGGLAGAVLFLAGYNTLPLFHGNHYGSLIGSSAAVIAIVTAVAILMPHFKMHMLFIGAVSVKWIALATIVLVLIGVTGSNAGGEIAHLGGILTGLLFALRLIKGCDITAPAARIVDRTARQRKTTPPNSPSSHNNPNGPSNQASATSTKSATSSTTSGLTPDERRELDTILDKIKKSGYSALTPAERDRLFNVSRKIK